MFAGGGGLAGGPLDFSCCLSCSSSPSSRGTHESDEVALLRSQRALLPLAAALSLSLVLLATLLLAD